MKSAWLVAALIAQLSAFGYQPQAKDQKPAQQTKAEQKEAAAIPASQVPGRRELMRNKRVVVSTVALAPGASLPMHRHERDYVSVALTDGQIRQTLADQGAVAGTGKKMGRVFGAMHVPGATGDREQAGDVAYHQAGFTHAEENKGKNEVRAVTVEFLAPAGKQQDPQKKSNKYCEAGAIAQVRSGSASPKGREACVDEKYLFCTDKFCVEDVTLDRGAVSTKHSHATDHMLVAITDYTLTDEIVGKGKKVRTKKAGEVEYIPMGITHQLTNTGAAAARFIVIAFK
jgi:quercetin dioxygenase-like cupin family protein